MATIDTIRQYFADILQRSGSEVTSAEINSYVSAVDSGALTLAQVRVALIQSPEGQDVQDVVRLYQTVFGRVPDKAGLNDQVDTLRGPATESDLANSFANSPEFISRFGGNTVNTAFINAVYQQVLGRTPSAGEVNFYLNSGFSAGRIALAFSESPEFQANTSTAVVGFLDAAGQGTAVYTGSLGGTTVNVGTTFTLTANTDAPGATAPAVNTQGTAQNDTFNAVVGTGATLSNGDQIDGGAGIDTLRVVTDADVSVVGANVKNVETLSVTNVDGTTAHTATVVGSSAFNSFENTGSTGAVSFTGASVVNGLAVSNTATATTVTYTDAAVAGATDVLSLSVSGVTATAGTGAAINVNSATGDASGVERINLSSNGSASNIVLNSNDTSVKNVTVSGSAALTVALGTNVAALTTFDASAATGSINVSGFAAATDVTANGGSANDRFDFGATLTSADKVNGGAGTDTVAVSTATINAAATADVNAIKALTNVEVLEQTGATSAIDASVITNINTFAFSGGTSYTVTGVEAGDSFQLKSDATSASFSAKVDGASDVLNLSTVGADFTGNVGGTNFETINLNVTNGTAADDTTFGTLTVNTNGKVAITGAGDVGFTVVGTNAIIDAGSLTGKLTVVGEAGNNAITGGSANDIITGAGGLDTIDLSKGGTDVVRLGTAAADRDTVTGFQAGAGGDIIDVGATQNATATANDEVGTAAFKDYSATQTAYTFDTANEVQEFSFNATNNSANLGNATNGTELFKAIANQGAAITGITTAAGETGTIVAYQNGNAYVYSYNAGAADTTVDATEVALVGTFSNVAVGSMTDANFA
ncbi:DUF4214 domain-containing protein [Aurantimonas coralicida]|uniref:DUF4214 domain-containing protein n=1 Tax=Aurantimonas coralicida TaxID=182270 RepID=UPI001E4E27E6|nr:DUF4214 domain-containing protein [Aurantimonas coralicida]MCD1645499.1 DUF4214 domain-containing protein [Aurantimonas coralicida]